jgi:mycoredoxin
MAESTVETSNTQRKIVMYGKDWCRDCHFAKRWFDTHGIAYEYINVEEDEQAAEYMLKVNGGIGSVPTIVFPDGSFLIEPTGHQLDTKLPLIK